MTFPPPMKKATLLPAKEHLGIPQVYYVLMKWIKKNTSTMSGTVYQHQNIPVVKLGGGSIMIQTWFAGYFPSSSSSKYPEGLCQGGSPEIRYKHHRSLI